MNQKSSRTLWIIAGLGLVIGLPLLGRWSREHAPTRCALTGLTIEPRFRVRLVEAGGLSWDFCCIQCAEGWLARRKNRTSAIYVTDEASGNLIDARTAFLVHSSAITNSITGNRIHAFRNQADAQNHARALHGEELNGSERPFKSEGPDP
jgi:NosL